VRNASWAVIRHMMERRCGSIVSIASISGMNGTIRRVAYSTAKAAIIGFTRVLAKEAAPYGIRVNSVSPGPIGTELFLNNPKEYIENGKKGVHLGRLGKPVEIAAMAAFLASDEAGYITGQNFIVDGGKSLGI
jgi:NAD(P)-dependent dehydrogenase (short-subunit alcohol dehydrogenase family)